MLVRLINKMCLFKEYLDLYFIVYASFSSIIFLTIIFSAHYGRIIIEQGNYLKEDLFLNSRRVRRRSENMTIGDI